MLILHTLNNNRLKETSSLLKEQEATSKGSEKNYKSDKIAHEKIKKEITKIEASIKKLCYNEGELEEMISKRWLNYMYVKAFLWYYVWYTYKCTYCVLTCIVCCELIEIFWHKKLHKLRRILLPLNQSECLIFKIIFYMHACA